MRNSKKRTLCILAAASTSLLMNIPAMASENTIALQYQKRRCLVSDRNDK